MKIVKIPEMLYQELIKFLHSKPYAEVQFLAKNFEKVNPEYDPFSLTDELSMLKEQNLQFDTSSALVALKDVEQKVQNELKKIEDWIAKLTPKPEIVISQENSSETVPEDKPKKGKN